MQQCWDVVHIVFVVKSLFKSSCKMMPGIKARTPDVTVAEMMAEGTLVYIDTLVVDGIALPKRRNYSSEPLSMNARPPMILRNSSDSVKHSSMESDEIFCVTNSRTLRTKVPTIDLLYKDGKLYGSGDHGNRSVSSRVLRA